MKRKKQHAKTRLLKQPTWQQQYEALRLNRWADIILGIPPGSNLPPKQPMMDFWIDDGERYWIALYLRRLAQSPKILGMLTPQKPRRRRGRPVVNGERDYKIALDYVTTTKRRILEKTGNAKRAEAEVMSAWGLKARSVLMKAHAIYSKDAHWKWWAEVTFNEFASKHAGMARPKLLLEFSNELRKPAQSAVTHPLSRKKSKSA